MTACVPLLGRPVAGDIPVRPPAGTRVYAARARGCDRGVVAARSGVRGPGPRSRAVGRLRGPRWRAAARGGAAARDASMSPLAGRGFRRPRGCHPAAAARRRSSFDRTICSAAVPPSTEVTPNWRFEASSMLLPSDSKQTICSIGPVSTTARTSRLAPPASASRHDSPPPRHAPPPRPSHLARPRTSPDRGRPATGHRPAAPFASRSPPSTGRQPRRGPRTTFMKSA